MTTTIIRYKYQLSVIARILKSLHQHIEDRWHRLESRCSGTATLLQADWQRK